MNVLTGSAQTPVRQRRWAMQLLVIVLLFGMPAIRGGALPSIAIGYVALLGFLIFLFPAILTSLRKHPTLLFVGLGLAVLQVLSIGRGLGGCIPSEQILEGFSGQTTTWFPCSYQPANSLSALFTLIAVLLLFPTGAWLASRVGHRFILLVFLSAGVMFGFVAVFKQVGVGAALGIDLLTLSEDPKDIELGFVNSNHSATYLSVALIIAVVWLFEQLGKPRPKQSQTVKFLCLLFILVCSILLFATQSRLGVLSGVSGAVFAASVAVFWGRKPRSLILALALIGIALIVVGLLQIEPMLQRLAEVSLSAGIRLSLYTQTLELIQQAPLFGTGIGSFEAVFPHINQEKITAYEVWNRAHNTYLAILAEQGAVGLLLTLLGFGILFQHFARLWIAAHSTAGMIGMSIILTVALHSLGDFSMEIFGMAGSTLLLLGALRSSGQEPQ